MAQCSLVDVYRIPAGFATSLIICPHDGSTEFLWNINKLLWNTIIFLWSIITLLWNIISLLWNTIKLLWNAITLLWSIITLLLNIITLLRNIIILLWNVISLFWNIITLLWNIITLLWNTITLLWNTITLLWSIITLLCNIIRLLWNIISLLWNINTLILNTIALLEAYTPSRLHCKLRFSLTHSESWHYTKSVVSSMPWPLYHQGKSSQYSFYRVLYGHYRQHGGNVKTKNLCPCLGSLPVLRSANPSSELRLVIVNATGFMWHRMNQYIL